MYVYIYINLLLFKGIIKIKDILIIKFPFVDISTLYIYIYIYYEFGDKIEALYDDYSYIATIIFKWGCKLLRF